MAGWWTHKVIKRHEDYDRQDGRQSKELKGHLVKAKQLHPDQLPILLCLLLPLLINSGLQQRRQVQRFGGQ